MAERMAGLVGGTGPESTIEYYKQIIARWRERVSGGSYPAMLITSLDGVPLVDTTAEHVRGIVAELAR